MLEIKLISKDTFFKSVLIRGHAGYSDYGYDIVCAGVSTLSMSLINYLNTFLEIDLEDLDYFSIENEEASVFSINVENDDIFKEERFQMGFKFFEIGIKSLLQDYSEYLKLVYQEV